MRVSIGILLFALTGPAMAQSNVVAVYVMGKVCELPEVECEQPPAPMANRTRHRFTLDGKRLFVDTESAARPTDAAVRAMLIPEPKAPVTLDEKLRAIGITRQDLKEAIK